MGKTYQTISVGRDLDAVWSRLNNFHDMSWAPSVITECTALGELGGTSEGAKRKLNGVFEETLLRVDSDKYLIEYAINDAPSPVSPQEISDYVGRIKLSSEGDGKSTLVEWSSSWKGEGVESAKFCHGIYKALLGELKNDLEE